MDAVLDDYTTAPIGEKERALFAFLDRMNHASTRLQAEDVAALVTAGWTQEAVYDAITVCALFHFYNKWIDATGVCDMPAAAYEASAERLAGAGYAPGQRQTTGISRPSST